MPMALTMDVCTALKKAGSTINASKTKNSSNKNKECISIAGAIVKLIEQNGGQSSNIGATVTVTLMRQMEQINNSMDGRDRWEKKERMKERKRRKK